MPRSPTEAGELTPSPKHEADSKMEDDSLEIKPPQTQNKKERHKRKHRHKESRRHESSREQPHSRSRSYDQREERVHDMRERLLPREPERYSRPLADRLGPPRSDSRGELRGMDKVDSRGELRGMERVDSRSSIRSLDRGGRERPPDERRPWPSDKDRRRLDEVSRRDKKEDLRRRSRSPLERDGSRDRRREAERVTENVKEPQLRAADSKSSASIQEVKVTKKEQEVITLISDPDEQSAEEASGEEQASSGEEEEEEEVASSEEESMGEEEEEEEEESSAQEAGSSEAEEEQSSADEAEVASEAGEEEDGHDETEKKKSKFESEEESDGSNSSSSRTNGVALRAAINNSPEADELPDSPVLSEPPTPPPQLPIYYPALMGCRSVDEFRCLNRIEEGTYGVVYRAEDLKMKEIVALKRLKMEKEKEGFPITSLREINTLLKAQHENIVTVREIVVGSNMDKIYLVMDYVEHDLKALMESMKSPFSIGEVKTLLLQLLKAVAHLHDNWILHRDLKTSNLLLSHKGILKVGDFGLAREYGSPLKPYTPIVVTLWYRAPELLLGTKLYTTAIDLWSVGCIFAEFLLMKPLWPGKNDIDQINKIFKDLGSPTEKIWPGVSELPAMKKCTFTDYPYNTLKSRFGPYMDEMGNSLLNSFLTYDPAKRVTAEEARKHKYFDQQPLPVDPSMFPTWPAKSEQPRKARERTPKPPSGGGAFKQLMDDEAGFHMAMMKPTAPGAGFNLKF